jgi:hypothetical protein
MKLTHVFGLSTAAILLAGSLAFADDVKVDAGAGASVGVDEGTAGADVDASASASAGANASGSGASGSATIGGTLGIDLGSAGMDDDSRKNYFASLSTAQQNDIRAKCSTMATLSSNEDATTASARAFCKAVIN